MIEFLQISLKTVYTLVRDIGARTTERRLLREQSSREHYASAIAEISRVTNGTSADAFLGVRVPFKNPIKFSLLVPGVLSNFERARLSERPDAVCFDDDTRGGRAVGAQRSILIPWSDAAKRVDNLLGNLWLEVREYPQEVVEIHADGTYLRALVQTSVASAAGWDTRSLKGRLETLAQWLEKQVLTDRKVPSQTKSMLWNLAAVVLALATAFVTMYMLPPIDYIDDQRVSNYVVWAMIGAFFASLLALRRRMSLSLNLKASIFLACVSILFPLSIYQRISYQQRGAGEEQDWVISSVTEHANKYTKKRDNYQLMLRRAPNQWNILTAQVSDIGTWIPKPGDSIVCRVQTDLLGFRYLDSAAVYLPRENGAPTKVEILRDVEPLRK